MRQAPPSPRRAPAEAAPGPRPLVLGSACAAALALAALAPGGPSARAQDADAAAGAEAGAAGEAGAPPGGRARADEADLEVEDVDTTRLDVERLPPEAIEVTRDMYAHGLFFEGHLGGRGFRGGIGAVSHPGPLLQVLVGYELFRFLHLAIGLDASLHGTNAPPPPGQGVFDVLGAVAELRLHVAIGPRFAFWLAGQFGVGSANDDVLVTYGVSRPNELGVNFGGRLGLDWHFRHRHYSMGLAGGARLWPGLAGYDGSQALAIDGSLYLRYVL
jgi:hypothetical protein